MKELLVFTVLLSLACASILRYPNWRIVGGENAKDGQFPYQISLRRDGSHSCGGSILNENWILTAAHCVEDVVNNPDVLSVVAGSTKISYGGQTHNVEKVIVHQDFSTEYFHNDIALLKLTTTIQFNELVQTIELNEEDIGADKDLVMSGWGYTSYPGSTPNDLKWINLKSITSKECHELTWGGQWDEWTVDETQICSLTKKGEGICMGDSGGPLVYNGKVAGLASWIYPSAYELPDVYTRVSSYVDWIKIIIN